MLTQLLAAQSDIGAAISELSRSGDTALIDQAIAQQQMLAKLERTLSGGAAITSSNIRGEIAAVMATSASLSQQAQVATEQRGVSELAVARARTRSTVQEMSRDIFERRIFDPYLQFPSADDEAAYRRREEESRRAIAEALAENTPQGDLRAARLVQRQLADAGANGADASPEFAGRMARINNDITDLERVAGSQQERQHDGDRGNQSAASLRETPPPASDDQLASVLATFRAAGIAGGAAVDQTGHGLNVNASTPSRSQTIT